MARPKQRENYGSGSVSAVMVNKVDGAGNIVHDADGRPLKIQKRDADGLLVWRVCITLGAEVYIDKSGSRRKRQRKEQRHYHGTLEGARRFAAELKEQYEHVDKSAAKMTFSDACSAWAESMRENETCAASKLKDYTTRLSYVAAHLGEKPLTAITTDDLEKALSAVKSERNQSQRTYRDCKRHVKRVFKFALSRQWVVFDPSAGLQSVQVRNRTVRRSLEASEFARLRACVDRDIEKAIQDFEQKEMRQAGWGNTFTRSSIRGLANISCLVGIRLLLSTGMRRGEVLALTWEKVDFFLTSVTIDHALNADAILKEPKTEAGVRTIAIDRDTMELLEQWKEFQAKALHLVMAVGDDGTRRAVGQSMRTPVVCSCVGSFLNPHNLNRWWNAYRVKIGFPTLKLHELRHTAATLLLGNGVPVIDVAARLGHDDVAVTLNTYGHAIPAHDHMAADLIGSLMTASSEPAARVLKASRASA